MARRPKIGQSIRDNRRATGRKSPRGDDFFAEQKRMRTASRLGTKSNAQLSKSRRNTGKTRSKEPSRVAGKKNTTGGFYA